MDIVQISISARRLPNVSNTSQTNDVSGPFAVVTTLPDDKFIGKTERYDFHSQWRCKYVGWMIDLVAH